jgi:hypothetical protein
MYIYIELISKSTCWKGDKGVVMHCKVTNYEPLYTWLPSYGHCVLPSSEGAQNLDITVWGTTEPTVWVKAMDGDSGYVDPTIITDPTINEEVRKWLHASPALSEWYEETARYRAAVAKVDLPYPPEDVQSEGRYLTYRFAIEGGREYDIQVVLEVDVDSTRATIGLQEAGNDDRWLHLGTANIMDTVTMENVKGVVVDSLYEFIGDLRDVVQEISLYGGWFDK